MGCSVGNIEPELQLLKKAEIREGLHPVGCFGFFFVCVKVVNNQCSQVNF
jgi:hypothetical protein